MKVARGIILGVLLAVYSVAGVGSAVAQNLCSYDTTGDYTYDPAASPAYLFYGDGQITYDGSLPWYMDDTLACYNVYKTAGYLPYFPKCDLDGDGQVAIEEVYDVYYRVHPVGQGDAVAQAACVEAFSEGPFFFCPPSRYNRTVTDIQTIIAAYPATEAIVASGGASAGHVHEGYNFDKLNCTTPGIFPPGLFDQLNACYLGAESRSLDSTFVTIDFAHTIDVTNAAVEYGAVAQKYGGSCLPETSGTFPGNTKGFHYKQHGDQGWWFWNVNATEQCIDQFCKCYVAYEFWTHRDFPGQVWLHMKDPRNGDCSDLRFVDCDTTLDRDADGTPDCIDFCPDDPTKTDSGFCGCGNPETYEDLDGNGYPDCAGPCYPGGDSDGDGICDMDDPCPGDPNNASCLPQCYPHGGDSDGDYVCDDFDQCPGENDLLDSDSDGMADCLEQCPLDPNKYEPGMCGCGEGDYDANGNGIADCLEECIHGDPNKIGPGVCGCHLPDIDDDGDGVYTCEGDLCDNDPNKTEPGECGCGQPEGTCPTCDDLAGTDWGSCASPLPLGIAVVDGACEVIDGCEIPAGVSMYPSMFDCQNSCTPCCASNDDCGQYQYCAHPMGDCGSGGCGECREFNDYCVYTEDLVCGCDGQTYTNLCWSMFYGVSLDHEGACLP